MIVETGFTFREITMNEPLPKGIIQQAIVELLKNRDDAAIFGALAVNAYVEERRMTEDIDLVSIRGKELAEEIRDYLNKKFHIAMRIRNVRGEIGFRIYQIAKPKNRHLVDVRPVDSLPPTQRIEGVLVLTPVEVIAGKVMSYVRRKGKPKSFTDRRDLAHMLLRFPEFKVEHGVVEQRLLALEADEKTLAFWRELVAEEILPEDDADEFS
jgi:hypothetical protein